MERILIQYGKDGALKYLSHLELMRALERAFRRAKVPVAMSGGFSPRPKISYGPALPVGVASDSEYLVAEICNPIDERQMVEKITSVLPEGLSVYRAKYILKKHPSITSVTQSMAYRVEVEVGAGSAALEPSIEQLRNEERLLIRHKGKEKWVDINQSILEWHVENITGTTAVFYLLLSAGDQNSVRPEVIVTTLSGMYSQLGGVDIIGIRRIGQFINRGNPLINIYNSYESLKVGSECKKP